MERAVFLDRDGVLTRSLVRNGRPYAPTSMEEFELLPHAREAVTRLKSAGFLLIVVTNQPDVAAGRLHLDILRQMHTRLRELLQLDDIRTCCHEDKDACHCRKPKPGLLLDAASQWAIDLKSSFMVGDRWRDISAGKAAGCRTIFVDCGYSEALVDPPDFVVASVLEASNIILADRSGRSRNPVGQR